MAVQHQARYVITYLMFLLIIFQQSTARPIGGFPAPKESILALPLENPFGYNPPRARPCDMASKVTTKSSGSKQKLLERYGPLLFHVLPRETPVPPSGPSKGGN